MAKQTLLHRVGRRYYLRRRVPLDLIRLSKQNSDLWKSLISSGGSRELGDMGMVWFESVVITLKRRWAL